MMARAFAALLSLTAVSLAAQSLDRAKRPVPEPPAAPRFPRVVPATLANGLHVFVVEDHALPLVAVRLVLSADSLLDPVGKEGLAAITTQLLGDATIRHTRAQLGDVMATIGTQVTPTRFTTITRNFAPALALMGDMIMHPSFEPRSLEERKAMRRAALLQPVSPGVASRQAFYKTVFGSQHPLMRSPTSATINAITRADVTAFYDAEIRPEHAALVIVGDVDSDEALRNARRAFGPWRAGGSHQHSSFPSVPESDSLRIVLLDLPGTAVSTIWLGRVGPGPESSDRAAVEVLASIVSRRVQDMRVRQAIGYAGGNFSFVWRRPPAPSLVVGIMNGIALTNTDSALTLWLHELTDIQGSRPPSDEEIETAQRVLESSLVTALETADATANRLAEMFSLGLDLNGISAYARAIRSTSASQLRVVAARYLNPRNLVVLVGGQKAAIEQTLRSLDSAAIVVDLSGKRNP